MQKRLCWYSLENVTRIADKTTVLFLQSQKQDSSFFCLLYVCTQAFQEGNLKLWQLQLRSGAWNEPFAGKLDVNDDETTTVRTAKALMKGPECSQSAFHLDINTVKMRPFKETGFGWMRLLLWVNDDHKMVLEKKMVGAKALLAQISAATQQIRLSAVVLRKVDEI